MIPKDVDKWDYHQWMRQTVYCKPSSSDSIGAIYVWAGRAYTKQAFLNLSEAAFIIRPLQGTAASPNLIRFILSKISRQNSPKSKTIARHSNCGQALLLTLKTFCQREVNSEIKSRWIEVFKYYAEANFFLIQETEIGIKEFGNEQQEKNELSLILSNKELMTNFGKLFIACSLVGNEDLSSLILRKHGSLASFEAISIFNKYQAILKDCTNLLNNSELTQSVSAQNKLSGVLIKFDAIQLSNLKLSTSFYRKPTSLDNTDFAFNNSLEFDKWWDSSFRIHLESGLNKSKGLLQSPPETLWQQAKEFFKQGVDEGIKQIDLKLSDFNWLMLKNSYKTFISKNGEDSDLDWRDFRVRCKYLKLLKTGATKEQAFKML